MENKINGVVRSQGRAQLVDLFGYSSKGLPGIEVVGIGNLGRALKEKFVYLSRQQHLKLPPRRYVLCVENREGLVDKDNFGPLEFPLLLLFWALAGQLPVARLDDCIAHGKVMLAYRVWMERFSEDEVLALTAQVKKFSGPGPKWIVPRKDMGEWDRMGTTALPAEDILGAWPQWVFMGLEKQGATATELGSQSHQVLGK